MFTNSMLTATLITIICICSFLSYESSSLRVLILVRVYLIIQTCLKHCVFVLKKLLPLFRATVPVSSL